MRSSSFDIRNISISKLLLLIWLLFITFYFFYAEYKKFSVNAAIAYNRGGSEAITQIVRESATCKPVPVSLDEKKMSFLNVACLKQEQ